MQGEPKVVKKNCVRCNSISCLKRLISCLNNVTWANLTTLFVKISVIFTPMVVYRVVSILGLSVELLVQIYSGLLLYSADGV